ncbi:MAG: class I SAM-dependent methyltransferase [Acidimicrobiales bacterium]|nr:class I SAM-dependent methyltransferase [Acidimicrobiales bacterium]
MAGSERYAAVGEDPSAVLERERRFFDRLVADHGEFNPFADRGWETLRRRFTDLASPRLTDALLDIGCGTGQSRRVSAGLVGRYVGVDLSPAVVEAARTVFPDDDWHVADACRLPFPNESFDLVAFSSVLHHIPDFGPAVREAFRVLRPGGRAFAFDPNVWHPAMALFRHPSSPLYVAQGVSPNERPLRPVSLRRAFAAAGLVDIRQRCQSDIPYRRVAPRLINAFLSVYNAVDWVWERVGLGRVFGTFVLTCGTKPVSTP